MKLKDPNKKVYAQFYDMEKYLSNAVDKYCAIASLEKARLKKVPTPFLDESQDPQGCAGQASQESEEDEAETPKKGGARPVAPSSKKKKTPAGGRAILFTPQPPALS